MAKKRGRPLGSKNRAKKKVASVADDAFGEAFGHVEIEPVPVSRDVAADVEDEQNFDVNDSVALYQGDLNDSTLEEMVAAHCELDDAPPTPTYEEQHDELEEYNIGFGSADVFDVEELMDLAGDGSSDDKKDIMQELRDSCIADNSKSNYSAANTLFVYYYYKYDQALLHKSWVKALNSFSFNITDEKKKEKVIKKTIKKLLQKLNENAPPIHFENYEAKQYMKYILTLQRKNGDKKTRLSC